MTTNEKLTNALEALRLAPEDHKRRFTLAESLRGLVASRFAPALDRLNGAVNNASPCDPSTATSNILLTVRRSEEITDFVAINTMLAALEADPATAAAEKVISPLVAKIKALENQLAAEIAAAQQAEQDLLDRKQAAIAEALAQVESQFATA